MTINSKIILVSVFSLVMPAFSYASLGTEYASLLDNSQSQAFESKPSALGPVLPDQGSLKDYPKIASVRFITDGKNGNNQFNGSSGSLDQEFTTEGICFQAGYRLKSCPAGYIKGEACPDDSTYVRECIDTATWCKEAGYILTCDSGKIGDTAQVCPYNDSYKKCICNPCRGFDYTAAEATAQGYVPGEVCNSCGTIKYKRTANACTGFKQCPNGGAAGAGVCYAGTVKMFDSCKSSSSYEVWYACDDGRRFYDYTTSGSGCVSSYHNYMYYPACNGYGYKYDVGCK